MAVDVEGATPLILVYDVPTAVAFYRDVLGFEVLNTSKPFDDAKDNFGWVLLRLGSVELMLNNMYEDNARPAQPDEVRSRHHSDTVIYFLVRDVDKVYAYLLSRHLSVHPPTDTYYGMRQVGVTDPDGYSLVFQSPVQNG